MTETVKNQIMAIRDSGETNMFDLTNVQRIAHRKMYYELAVYLEEHKNEYWDFIMTGKAPMADEQ